MKRLLAFGLAVLVCNASAAPMAKTVWIASTNVVGLASGSLKYPLDGSTAEKFDALLRGFPDFTRINLLSGLFETTGSASYNAQGFYVKRGWKIVGRGMYATTVRHVAAFPESFGGALCVFEDDYQSLGGITISGMTVDEGGQHLVGKSASTAAVRLHGNDNISRDVRSVNGYGHRASLAESFHITIGARYDQATARWQDNTNGLIEGCVVEGYRGDYGIAVALVGGADGRTGSVQGKVRNCFVRDFNGTAPFGLASFTTWSGNTASNCWGGFYTDTGLCVGNVIQSNALLRTHGIAIHTTPGLGAAQVRDLWIDANIIEIDWIGVALSGPLGPGHTSSVRITRNIFRPFDSSRPPPLAIMAAYVNGLSVSNNVVDSGMSSQAQWPEYPSTDVILRGNRIPGEPKGLETN